MDNHITGKRVVIDFAILCVFALVRVAILPSINADIAIVVLIANVIMVAIFIIDLIRWIASKFTKKTDNT